MNLHLDFETFSTFDIKYGAYKYSEDPSTEVLMCSYKVDDEETKLWINSKGWPVKSFPGSSWIMDEVLPYELMELLEDPEVLIWAHNVQFEKAIIENVLCKSFGLEIPAFTRYRCTAALGRSLSLPSSLEDLAIGLKLQQEKDKAGKALIRKFSKPRKPTKKDPRTRVLPFEDPEDFISFCNYCIQDTNVEHAIHERLKKYEFKSEELDIWLADLRLNDVGVPIDVPSVRKGLGLIDEYSQRETVKFRTMSGGINPSQRDKAMAAINEALPEGYEHFENMQAGTIDAWFKHHASLKGHRSYEMLKIKRSLGRSSTKKLEAMVRSAGSNDRVRGSLLFHGATTGRWAGRLIQPQNLPRPSLKDNETLLALDAINTLSLEDIEDIYGDPLAAVSSVIRHYIAAPEGREFIVADYSAIEARVVAWLAGQEDAVRMFAREVQARREWQDGKISGAEYKRIKNLCDPYIEMAALVYNKDPKLVTKDERALGKAIVLGCGYNMGWKTFYETCLSWGIKIDPMLAKRSVTLYREKYHKIKQLWTDIEKAALKAMMEPGKVFKCQKVQFKKSDCFLFMRLPSGRKIAYPYPRVVMKEKFGQKKPTIEFWAKGEGTVFWKHRGTYGGKLTENAVQAIARDLMGNGMVESRKLGYEIITSIHDEAISEVDEGQGSVVEFERALCNQPAWADGIPLASEGYRDKRYKKD